MTARGEAMTEEQKVLRALAMVEACVQDMAEEGLSDINMASALALHMHQRIAQALPPRSRRIWLEAVLDPSSEPS